MNKVVIIGAGQIGSRHLQGLSYCDVPLDIYVIDTNNASLEIAEKRWQEADGNCKNHLVRFSNQFSSLPSQVDILIVATGASGRISIIRDFFSYSDTKNIVLEKIVFQSVSHFAEMEAMIDKRGLNVFVNCPRRLGEAYNYYRAELLSGQMETIEVTGNSLGIGCNAIHFIDLACYLGMDESTLNIENSMLDLILLESKRIGYKEFTGTLIVRDGKGAELRIKSTNIDTLAPIVVNIETKEKKYVFVEDHVQGKLDVEVTPKRTSTSGSNRTFFIKRQSQLTGTLAKDLLVNNRCLITSYHESMKMHIPLLDALSDHICKITGEKPESCPIT